MGVALYLQDHPKTFETAAGIALRLRHSVEAVEPVVERFADYGLLRRVRSRDGSYCCYTLERTPAMWNLLCMVSEAYLDDPEMRKQIVRMLVSQRQQQAAEERKATPPANS